MENKTVMSIETVIDYIEANLDGKLDLEMVTSLDKGIQPIVKCDE